MIRFVIFRVYFGFLNLLTYVWNGVNFLTSLPKKLFQTYNKELNPTHPPVEEPFLFKVQQLRNQNGFASNIAKAKNAKTKKEQK
jgi:hypothetical protein